MRKAQRHHCPPVAKRSRSEATPAAGHHAPVDRRRGPGRDCTTPAVLDSRPYLHERPDRCGGRELDLNSDCPGVPATGEGHGLTQGGRHDSFVSQAAIGSLCSCGRPCASNRPRPVPSGFLRLCADRLSGAFSNQKVAVQTCVPACKPKSRHMVSTVPKWSARQPFRVPRRDTAHWRNAFHSARLLAFFASQSRASTTQ